ncbi:hypothetical protein [Brevibacterium paucivorans]
MAIATVTYLGFYPGRAEYDISDQAKQMLGMKNLSDWHPPIVAILWRGLFAATGKLGSLLAFQLGVYFLAVFLLAVFAHRVLNSKIVSLMMVAVLVSPWAYSQLNGMWKDTIMAALLLFAAGCLGLVTPKNKKTFWFIVPAVLLLIFATVVRKNAAVAVVPMCIYVGWRLAPVLAAKLGKLVSWMRKERLKQSAVTMILGLVIVGFVGASAVLLDSAIAKKWKVKPTHQIYQVVLDDVMFSVPEVELNRSSAPQELKDKINEARPKCYEMNEPYDAYWNCYGRGSSGSDYSPLGYRDELKQLWLDHVITHPKRYIEYRWSVYKFYLSSSVLVYLPNKLIIPAKQVGLRLGDESFERIAKKYVVDFGKDTIGYVFKPWFWLLAGALVFIGAWWSGRSRAFALMLTSSAFLYIFAYFPVVPANHFRYTYWPALAISAAFVAVVAGVVKAWKDRRGRSAVTCTETLDKLPQSALASANER